MTVATTNYLYSSLSIHAFQSDDDRLFVHTDPFVEETDGEWKGLLEALKTGCWHRAKTRKFDDPEVLGGVAYLLVYRPCQWFESSVDHSEVCPYREE